MKWKKVVLVFGSTGFLFGFANIYVKAHGPDNNLSHWLQTNLQQKLDLTTSTLSVFMNSFHFTDFTHKDQELHSILETSTTKTQEEILIHLENYLNDLSKTKEHLKQGALIHYTERKEGTIHIEMENELAEFLTELIGE
ncbi:hypothetical protein [Sutcliffiella halmapala]|uniref:hypothetical protein n=1 Tax=Sutcliffiella halmapala TaxID=79882 RepID=UPI00099593D4|nr:hypothetical protein [Sutcliffiella halmapala]